MRKLVLAVIVPLLAVACASQPQQQKLAGSYAVVLDPQLPTEHVRGMPLLHNSVRAMLERRLELAPSVAEADAVVTLKPAREPHRFEYEIRRGDRVVAGSAPIRSVTIGSELSMGERLHEQRRFEQARNNPSPDLERRDPVMLGNYGRYGHQQWTAHSRVSNQIAAEILRDLRKL